MLIENPDIAIVAVMTPSGMHFEHALELIETYNVSVVLEKPTVLRPGQLRILFEAAKVNNVEIFPVFQNRYNKAVQRVKKALDDGDLGDLRLCSVRVRWNRPQRYYDLAPWRGTFALDGGALTNQGIHHIDLLRFLGGEVKRVSSKLSTLRAEIEVEDTAVAIVEFESGAIGTLEITTAAEPIDYEASLSVVCSKGLAQIGGIAVNELQIFTPDDAQKQEFSEDFSKSVYGNGHSKIYEQIADTLQRNVPFSMDLEEVERTITLLNAFYVSDEEDSWVEISDQKESSRLGLPNEALSDLYRLN